MDIRKHITPIVFLLHLPLLGFVLATFHESFVSLSVGSLIFIGSVSLIMGITMSVVHWILMLAMDELFPKEEVELAVSEQPQQIVWMDTYILQPVLGNISMPARKKQTYLNYYGV